MVLMNSDRSLGERRALRRGRKEQPGFSATGAMRVIFHELQPGILTSFVSEATGRKVVDNRDPLAPLQDSLGEMIFKNRLPQS